MLKVYIVAEFEPLRIGLVDLISSADDMQVTGEAASLRDLAHVAAFREADVVVVDADALSNASGGLVHRQITEWLPALKVLFLGTREDAPSIRPEDLPAYKQRWCLGLALQRGQG